MAGHRRDTPVPEAAARSDAVSPTAAGDGADVAPSSAPTLLRAALEAQAQGRVVAAEALYRKAGRAFLALGDLAAVEGIERTLSRLRPGLGFRPS